MDPQKILDDTRQAICDYSGNNPDKWFYANRFVFARLQLDERKTKTNIKRKLIKSHNKCSYCREEFASKTGIHLHRIDNNRGYSLKNCALMHQECHIKFHRENSRVIRNGRNLKEITSFASPVLEKESKRYNDKTFIYWWDISPSFIEDIDNYEAVVLVKKDTKERCYVSIRDLKGYLTEARRTTRDKGNWGIRVLKDRENDLAFEPGQQSLGWLFLPVIWLNDEED